MYRLLIKVIAFVLILHTFINMHLNPWSTMHSRPILPSFDNLNFQQRNFCLNKNLEELDDNNLEIKLSNDGKLLSYIFSENDSDILCIKTLRLLCNHTKRIALQKDCTKETCRKTSCNIYKYGWCHNPDYLWYLTDCHGNERFSLFSVNHKNNVIINLTPDSGVNVKILKISPRFPDEILILKNNYDSIWYNIYQVNIRTGYSKLILKNDLQFIDFLADSKLNPCFGIKVTKDCSKEIYRKLQNGDWKLFDTIPFEDFQTTQLFHISNDGKKLYLKDSREQNTSALIEVDLNSGQRKVMATNNKADLCNIAIHPESLEVEAACFAYDKEQWLFLDNFNKETRLFLEILQSNDNCIIDIVSRDFNDTLWIVKVKFKDKVIYYLFDKQNNEFIELLLSHTYLFETKVEIIKSRDDIPLVCYLTLPVRKKSQTQKMLPMILLVHGGPWTRDKWGLNAAHQKFASQGYVVLSVNFRGSTGFGKKFLNAGIGEWGGKMLDDLIDATRWMVEKNSVDPDKIGIYGESYGGYAALTALTFAPNVFACGVSFCGPSNLITLIEGLPKDCTPEKEWFRKTLIGTKSFDQSQHFLHSKSPLFFTDQIRAPILIGHGANDPRVKQSESVLFFDQMKQNQKQTLFALFSDEGHYLVQSANHNIFAALAQKFFAKHLKHKDLVLPADLFDNTSMLLQET